MKKLLLIFIGMLSMSLCYGLAVGQENKGPKMVVEGREFDFKEVKEGSILEHTFNVFNKGNEPLKIISVRPG